jgi:F0F1-type ATP synthase membrane subunit b/b'
MNFALELFLTAAAIILSIVVVAELVWKAQQLFRSERH